MEPNIEPQNGSHKGFYSVIIGFVVVCLVVGFGAWTLIKQGGSSPFGATDQQMGGEQRGLDATDLKVQAAYDKIATELSLAPGDPILTEALETFREVAMDESVQPIQRARALNGMNYAYTQSNFDADAIYNVVFSRPPFDQYYTAADTTTPDPLHPRSGQRVEAVEKGLAELSELSVSLFPNHYAIARLGMANLFAYQRAVARNGGKELPELKRQRAEEMRTLAESYEVLPDIATLSYTPTLMTHIMFAQASVLAFVAAALDDDSYWAKSEAAFAQVIGYGEKYPTNEIDSLRVINGTLLARIFYASHFWKVYKDSDPERVRSVLRPLTDENAVRYTVVYNQYLPGHRNAQVSPFTVLREIAGGMPELKTFLQGRGWTF